MLCEEVKRVIYFFLDNQLGESRRRDVSTHLDGCPDCDTRTRVHLKLRQFVQERMTGAEAPERLRQRLLRSVRAFRTEWTS